MIENSDDYIGHRNLETVLFSYRFNNWIYGQISRDLRGSILEVGSGLGVFSEKIVRDMNNSEIVLTDKSMSYLSALEGRFADRKNITVSKLDLDCISDYQLFGYNRFDTIIAINVLEHVKDDELVFRQFYKMLRKNGIFIFLVPSYKFLQNPIDEAVGHLRRYTKKELRIKIHKCHFVIEQIKSFNLAGILGWYVNGKLFKDPVINTHALRLFDYFVPFWKFLDYLASKKIGLSIICYLRKVD